MCVGTRTTRESTKDPSQRDHGAMRERRVMRDDRGLCADRASSRVTVLFPVARGRFCCCARIRAMQGESERATCAGFAWRGPKHHRDGRADHFPAVHDPSSACTKMFQVRTTPSGDFARPFPARESHLGRPLDPAESHLKLVFRSDREPAHVVCGHTRGREETGVGVLCCEIALAGRAIRAARIRGCLLPLPNGVESTSFGCRKPGSAGLPTARYLPPATL